MTEMKQQKIALDALLVGAPLLTFLMELAAIEESTITEGLLEPMREGEIALGEMLPFEKRVFAWSTARKEQASQELKRIKETLCETCGACDIVGSEFRQACTAAVKFDDETDKGIAFLHDSIRARFPDAKGAYLLRKGFMVVQSAKPEKSARSEMHVHVVSGFGFEGLLGILASGLARKS
ncbi:MAG: hypothetical protein UW32_C0001G0370 [Candidatus Wolfebacteria bacterium GW2011_GWE2_44_13]|uniref:Uncharacterized protein n=1 Tax=Candidatus Wolfebacteria bacterium GW2011_GWE2_44_13 TaxID=1619017 RepID=A0A0G1HB73_9BACT|nr:MAG: hypothetical protein UW32_C0001G0370 [Candidatus Wolfebacteria bacterium GW2011_GWE2_44_13]